MGKIIKALEKAAQERANLFEQRPELVKKVQPKPHVEPKEFTPQAIIEGSDTITETITTEQIPEETVIVNPLKDSPLDPRLITYFDSKSVVSEQYKILATNLLSLNRGNPPQTIAITSSIAGEGKTLTAINLAITLAKAVHNPRIIIVDADMRKGQMFKYLGIPKDRKGLSHFLNGQVALEEVISKFYDIENLSFIPSGPTPLNPAELLASGRMRQLILALRAQYDIVLIDTPPVIPVTDAVIVGSNVEGVLMVIGAGRTQRGMVSRASELLVQSNANIVGYTLTSIEYFVPDYIYRYL